MTGMDEVELRRAILAGAVAWTVGFLAFHAQASMVDSTDFAQIWHAAKGWLQGQNPYDVVGPQGSFRWPFPLLYPATAVAVGVPFALLPAALATASFVGLGAGALAWALGRSPQPMPGAWWLFSSAAFVYVVRTAQWSPLLMAAALTPATGWLLACKPSLGLALFAAYPRRRTAIGIAVFVAATILVLPTWPIHWLRALPAAYHMTAPVTYVTAGGPLILLALLRWRRPEARLLVALACVPHTTMLYEALPLFLVARRWQEGALLSALSWVCFALPESRDYLQRLHSTAWSMTLLLYLPCAIMVLLRPDVEPDAGPTGGRCVGVGQVRRAPRPPDKVRRLRPGVQRSAFVSIGAAAPSRKDLARASR